MDDEARLLIAIRDDPDSDDPRLVYADWLAERGDPRGELIVLQCELARADDDARRAELEERNLMLLDEHARDWADTRRGGVIAPTLELAWRRGFVDHIHIDHDPEAIQMRGAAELVGRILKTPAGHQVRALSSRSETFIDDGYAPVLAAIVEAAVPLRWLSARFEWPGDIDLGAEATELGEVGALWALPALEHVELEGYEMSLGTIRAPMLRYFEMHVPYGVSDENMTAIANAHWPRLESLIINRCDARLDLIRPILDGTGLPALKHLRLVQARAELIDQVADSRILPQLETLELEWINTSEPEPTLDPKAPAFRHLKEFVYKSPRALRW